MKKFLLLISGSFLAASVLSFGVASATPVDITGTIAPISSHTMVTTEDASYVFNLHLTQASTATKIKVTLPAGYSLGGNSGATSHVSIDTPENVICSVDGSDTCITNGQVMVYDTDGERSTAYDIESVTGKQNTREIAINFVTDLTDYCTVGCDLKFKIFKGINNPTTSGAKVFHVTTNGVVAQVGDIGGITLTNDTNSGLYYYQIVDPTDGTVDAPISVTVRLLDQYGNLVTTGAGAFDEVTIEDDSWCASFANGGVVTIGGGGTGSLNLSSTCVDSVAITIVGSPGDQENHFTSQSASFAVGAEDGVYLDYDGWEYVGDSQWVEICLVDQFENDTGANNGHTEATFSVTSGDGVFTDETVNLSGGCATSYIDSDVQGSVSFTVAIDGYDDTGSVYFSTYDGNDDHVELSVDHDTRTAGQQTIVTATYKNGLGATINSDAAVTLTGYSDATFGEGNELTNFVDGVATWYITDTSVETLNLNVSGYGAVGTSVAYTAGALDHYDITSSSYTLTAGTPQQITITAKDAYGNTLSSGANDLNGTKSMEFQSTLELSPNSTHATMTDDTGESATVVFGDPTEISFTHGVTNYLNGSSYVTLYKAGVGTLNVIDAGEISGTSDDFTVTHAASATYTLSVDTDTASVDDSITVTATLADPYGNTSGFSDEDGISLSGLTGTVTGGESAQYISGEGPVTWTLHNTAVEELTLGIESDSVYTHSDTQVVDFTEGEFAYFSISDGGEGDVTAGVSRRVYIQARDQYGNLATAYAGAKSVRFGGPGDSPTGFTPDAYYTDSDTHAEFGNWITIDFTAGESDSDIELTLYNAEDPGTYLTVQDDGGHSSYYNDTNYAPRFTVITNAAQLHYDLISIDNQPHGMVSDTDGAGVLVQARLQDDYGNLGTDDRNIYLNDIAGVALDKGQNQSVGEDGYVTWKVTATWAHQLTPALLTGIIGDPSIYSIEDGTEKITFYPGDTDHFKLVSNEGSSWVLAGAARTYNLEAYDAYDNLKQPIGGGDDIATEGVYSGGHRMTFSGPTSSPFGDQPKVVYGGDYNFGTEPCFNFADGVSDDFDIVLYNADEAEPILVHDTHQDSGDNYDRWAQGDDTYAVPVGNEVANALTVVPSLEGHGINKGTPFDVTVTAVDIYGNRVTGYNDTDYEYTGHRIVLETDADMNRDAVRSQNVVTPFVISPSTYLFRQVDRGQKVFHNAVVFNVGSQDDDADNDDLDYTDIEGDYFVNWGINATDLGTTSIRSSTLDSLVNEDIDPAYVYVTIPDSAAPYVTGQTPDIDTGNISVNVQPVVSFNEALDPTTITTDNIKLCWSLGEGCNDLVTTLIYGANGNTKVVIVPTEPLEPHTQYWIQVYGVKDVAGNTMSGAYLSEWSFQTASEPEVDTDAPHVAWYDYGEGTEQVTFRPSVYFTTSDIDLNTVNNSTIKLYKSNGEGGGELAPALVSYIADDGEGHQGATLIPVSNLDYNSSYYVELIGVKDLAGNDLELNGEDSYSQPVDGGGLRSIGYLNTVDFPTAPLATYRIDSINTYASADDTYENGWKWVFNITLPTAERYLQMKFSDFMNGSDIISVLGNLRYYSEQSSDYYDADHTASGGASGVYGDYLYFNDTDLDSNLAGRQVQVTVEMKIPEGSADGSYSTSYQLHSNNNICIGSVVGC